MAGSAGSMARSERLEPDLQICPGSRLLTLRGLSPREPAIPVADALAQLRPLNAELSAAGGSALQARVLITTSLLCLSKVSLRCSWEQDGLLICAIGSDDAVALVVLMIPLSLDPTDPQRFAPTSAIRPSLVIDELSRHG